MFLTLNQLACRGDVIDLDGEIRGAVAIEIDLKAGIGGIKPRLGGADALKG